MMGHHLPINTIFTKLTQWY